jgi:hypothetical protein
MHVCKSLKGGNEVDIGRGININKGGTSPKFSLLSSVEVSRVEA